MRLPWEPNIQIATPELRWPNGDAKQLTNVSSSRSNNKNDIY